MKKITLVEDDPDLREMLQVVLKSNQYSVEAFANGEAFMQHSGEPPDLFLIDVNLGGISGPEICQSLKADPRTKHTPIIIISAHPEVERLSREACADDYLTKPFSQKVLLLLLSKYL